MGLEVPVNDLISELNPTWPLDGDLVSAQNEHTQLIKQVLQTQFPGNTSLSLFTGTFTFDGVNFALDYDSDKGTSTITRKGTYSRVGREAAAAVVWTIGAFSTEDWKSGDIILAYLAPGVDVQVVRAAAGQFSLPDGTTSTTIEATTDGKIELLYLGSDNWRLMRQ